jgi:selenocysteine lyase/cysteine desulfurase
MISKTSDRRSFLKQTAGVAGALSLTGFMDPLFAAEMQEQAEKVASMSPAEAAQNEDFWGWVRENYTVSSNIINLNNGGVSPQPKVVQDAHIKYYQMCNEGPSYYMWRILDQGRESLRMKLADLAGCSAEEIAINRNSTEGLNTIIFGLNLKAGDEVVVSKYDYPNMMNAWKQREKRDGIKLVWIDLPLPCEDDAILVSAFEKAITAKTKIVHITHMINWNGQLLPSKAIADMAHSKGCEVIVDGAHTFAHIDYKIADLGADYYATSLHKWLCAPFGSGLMYIKKDKIKNIWALLSNDNPDGEDIRKFESLGTRSFASEMAIGNAVDFHNIIGSKRKEERLRYLKNYWAEKAVKIPKVKLNTSLLPKYSCALANVSVEGWEVADLDSRLFEKYKIHVVGINREAIHGVRVTPNVYTSLKDLDRLVMALEEISKMDPPAKKAIDTNVKK